MTGRTIILNLLKTSIYTMLTEAKSNQRDHCFRNPEICKAFMAHNLWFVFFVLIYTKSCYIFLLELVKFTRLDVHGPEIYEFINMTSFHLHFSDLSIFMIIVTVDYCR